MKEPPMVDQIINNRLLLKYQRPLSTFSIDYINLLQSPPSDPVLKSQLISSLLQDISTLQFQIFKYQTALHSIEQDNISIQTSLQSTNTSILNNEKEIEELKATLAEEKKKMENKMQYNLIAEQVKMYGKKSETLKEIESVRAEIEAQNRVNQKELKVMAEQESYLLTMISSLSCLLETTKGSE